MTAKTASKVFDYRALRLLIGIIAFALPIVVSIVSSSTLSSISASYHTEARDFLVGMLFIVSAFFMAYNGHTTTQAWASKLASIAAMMVALFPTSCDTCDSDIISIIHYSAAVVLFSILAYFCFGPFREKTKGQEGKKGLRSKIYFACGCIMVGCLVIIGLSEILLSGETQKAWRITYWGEAIALAAFGVAWIVAGKYFKVFVDKQDMLQGFITTS